MAKTNVQSTAAVDEYEYRYPGWVYNVPALFLIVGGFGGLAYLTLF